MQYLGICQQGKRVDYNPKLHAGVLLKFLPEEDGLTFHLNACFTDSLRRNRVEGHAAGDIRLEKFVDRWSRWMIPRLRSVLPNGDVQSAPHVGHLATGQSSG